MAPTAIVLVSGGLDSTTCLAVAQSQGYDIIALSFDYGQRHRVELDAAHRVAAHYGVKHHFVTELGLFRDLGGSALTDSMDVPQHETAADIGEGIPVTYVPARNLVFLSLAVGVAEVHQSTDIFIGVNALDYSGYPDCRPAFINAFTKTANLATKIGVEGQPLTIHMPLVDLTKAGIIELGTRLQAPYHLTHSCYAPIGDVACGRCDSCLLRLKGFLRRNRSILFPTLGRCRYGLCGQRGFYTLQGEGAQSGRAAVFCRFTGCNLWSGREEDRSTAACRFCDTDFMVWMVSVGDDLPTRTRSATTSWCGKRGPEVYPMWSSPVENRVFSLTTPSSPRVTIGVSKWRLRPMAHVRSQQVSTGFASAPSLAASL